MRLLTRFLIALAVFAAPLSAQVKISAMTRTSLPNDSTRFESSDTTGGQWLTRAYSMAQLRSALAKFPHDSAQLAGNLTFTGTNARILGTTNGLSIRNSGNTRDNFAIADAGTSAHLSDGTNSVRLYIAGSSGEQRLGGGIASATAGNYVQVTSATSNAATTGGIAGIYANGTQFFSAWEVANVASGFGTLSLMKSGGQVAVGTANASALVTIGSSFTSVAGQARALHTTSTLTASANGDTLLGHQFSPTMASGGFTGVITKVITIDAFSVAGFTSPGTPIGIDIGVITGKAGTSGYGLRIAPPTGSDNNYLIAHTTASTFNIKADGTATFGGSVNGTATSNSYLFGNQGNIGTTADGVIVMQNNATTSFGRLQLGGTTNAFPSIKRNSASIDLRVADDSGYTTLNALNLNANGVITATGKITTYNNINTAGWGVPAIQADGGSAGNSNTRAAAMASYTVGAADGTFVVSAFLLVNSGTAFSFSLNVSYTDEGNTARVLVLPLAQLAGTFVATGLATNVTGTGPYESASMTIRCKAATTITIQPSSGGTYTTVNYDVFGNIRQVA